jgi:hypothetical protein
MNSLTKEKQMQIQISNGVYKNEQGAKLPCARCNRSVLKNATFHVHEGLVFGPECMVHVMRLDVPPEQLAAAAKEQYRVQMREATLAGMAKKGLLKPEKPALPVLSDEQLALLGK